MITLEQLQRQKLAKQQASDSLDDCGELQDLVKRWRAELEKYCEFQTTDAAAMVSDALSDITGELWKIEATLLEGE